MNVVEIAARNVEGFRSGSDVEQACRKAVARVMRSERRLLTADEVEDVVEDVVDAETSVDVEDKVEGDHVEMTDVEWDSVPVEEKVMFDKDNGEVVEGVVVGGRLLPVKLSKDFRASVIAERINMEVSSTAHLANVNEGVNVKSLYHPVPDVKMPCPKCASENVTPVWYDDGEVIACCNSCGNEFEADVDVVAKATLAERTVEDIDILPEFDVFGSVWYQEDGKFGFEVYSSGDLVDAGDADTFEEVQERFDDIADAYDELDEGVEVDFANGESDVIDVVDGDELLLEGGKRASRARVARMVADRKAFIDKSKVARCDFRPGQVVATRLGNFVVESSKKKLVSGTMVRCTADGRLSEQPTRFTPLELISIAI